MKIKFLKKFVIGCLELSEEKKAVNAGLVKPLELSENVHRQISCVKADIHYPVDWLIIAGCFTQFVKCD